MKPQPKLSVSHESDAGHVAELSQAFRPYATYKNSGVAWLGAIPSHWRVMRLKSLANVQLSNVDKNTVEDQVPVRLCNHVDVYYNEQVNGEVRFMEATATPDQVRRFSLMAGDVLITKDSEAWTDIAVPSVVTQTLPGVLCGYRLAQIRPYRRCHGPFLSRAFAANGLRDQYHVAANGITRFGLTRDAIRDGLFPLPPLLEQRSIASFLDRETAKIDAPVAKKERLIELLTEKRTALITRAVTEGLEATVPMKDSGVEWLGWIPAHWDVKRINQTSEILRGKFTHRPRNDPSLYGGDWPFIQTGDVARAQKAIKAYRQSLNERGLAVSKVFPAGTIAANIGDVTVLDFAACFPDSIVGFVPRYGIERDYLFLVLSAIKPALVRDAPVNIQGSLNIERIGSSSPIPIPPKEEQNAIIKHLDRETAKIDQLVDKVREAIDRLNELRTALVSAAITGKIDIRERAT